MANELKFKSNVSITGNLNSASFSIDKFAENNLPSGDLVDGSLIYNSDSGSILIWNEAALNWDGVFPAVTGGTIQGKDGSGYDIQPTNQPPFGGGNVVGDARNNTAVDLQMTRSASDQVAAGGRSAIIGGGDNKAIGINSGVYCGFGNFAEENYATCIGGQENQALGIQSITLGGYANVASGEKSIALGGANSTADGGNSLVAGRWADTAGFVGARVFADSTLTPHAATQNFEFAVQASAFTVTGNVGVGTQSPTETIEARGNILSTITDGTQSTLIRDGIIELRRDTEVSYIDFKHGDYDYDARIESTTNGGLNFYVGGDGNIITDAFVIKSDGNIGIGTSLPTSKLQILDGNIALETTGGSRGFITQEETGDLLGDPGEGIGFCGSSARLPSEGGTGGADLFVRDTGETLVRKKLFALTDVQIKGQLQIEGGSPGPNKVLTCDAAGVATWELSGVSASLTNLQTVYVSKDGNDLNGGTNIGESKLTISAAILSLEGESNAHTIQVLDDGIYEEEITLTNSVSLYAPFATIVGQIELGAFSRVIVDKHYWGASTSTDLVVLGPSAGVFGGITASYEANLMDTRGITGGEGNTNSTAIKLAQVGFLTEFHVKVGTIRLGDHRGITITGTGASLHNLYFNIDTIELYATNAKGIYTGTNDTFGAQYIGTIGNIISKGGINHAGIFMVTTANATVNVKCNQLRVSGGDAASYRIWDAFSNGNPDSGELYISCNNIVTDNRVGTPAYENSNLSSGGTPGTALSGTVAGGSGSTEIFVNGDGSTRMIVPIDTTWMFTALIAGRSATESAGYKIEGVIKNDGGTTSLVGTAIKTVFGEDDPTWDATVNANNTALTFLVTGDSTDSVNWSATVNKTEVN